MLELPIDPTQVFRILILFIGVYTEVYNIKLAAPNPAVRPFTPKYNIPIPVDAATVAKPTACNGLKIINIKYPFRNRYEYNFQYYLKIPLTKTLFLVLDICESNGTSKNWFIELAAPDTKPVPSEHNKNVVSSKGAGAIAYPAIDVITTRARKHQIFEYIFLI